jgi:DNA polymerase-3 subunit delta
MRRNLEAVLAGLHKGKAPSLLLVHGDSFQVHSAVKAILELLVAPEKRAFNLEHFDGRSTAWDQIEAALMTPPFFPGRKAVFVEDVPYFLSREHKEELGHKALQLWGEGKKDEAARSFLDLLLLEGWTQEKWERLQGPPSAAQTAELFGAQGKEVREDVAGLVDFCRARGMDLGLRAGEAQRLTELLEQGLPPWAFLLITASHVDRRTRLYRQFDQSAAALDLGLERDRAGRISRDTLAEFVDRHLKEAEKRIEPQAREAILLRAGAELWAVHQELEKLLLYVGEEPWVKVKDVEEVFLDQGEGWVFDLTKAIGERNSLGALQHLARLLSHGDHPLKLLGAIAGEVRRLLAARQLIEGELRQKWSGEMTYPQFQATILKQGSPLVARSPYGDYMSFRTAENFTTQELLRDLEWIYQADIRLKSSASPPRMVMERLVLEMCQRLAQGKMQNEN